MTNNKDKLDKIMLDPTMFFDSPQEVLDSADYLKSQKIEILERWKYDAKELEIADDENMAEVNSNDILDEILEALNKLKPD